MNQELCRLKIVVYNNKQLLIIEQLAVATIYNKNLTRFKHI